MMLLAIGIYVLLFFRAISQQYRTASHQCIEAIYQFKNIDINLSHAFNTVALRASPFSWQTLTIVFKTQGLITNTEHSYLYIQE